MGIQPQLCPMLTVGFKECGFKECQAPIRATSRKKQRVREVSPGTAFKRARHLFLPCRDAGFPRRPAPKSAKHLFTPIQIEALVTEAEEEAALVRRRSGSRVLGVKAILAQDPLTRPDLIAWSPAPLVHAATKAARRMFYELYAEFVSAFRTASEALRQGSRDTPFPAGSFPPALPFVPG